MLYRFVLSLATAALAFIALVVRLDLIDETV
jgi:hypothetical protein